jgi:lipopolysaccharide biosynthesis regulator YciM
MAKFKIKINDIENIKELLQIAYQTADEQLIQAQNEITKMASATHLQDEIMDAKEKYAKAINNYLTIKDKAISRKLEIAKLLTELYKHDGDVDKTMDDISTSKQSPIDVASIRELLNNSNLNKTETIQIK